MPRPRSEHEQWEAARAEIHAQIATLERDLAATPIENTPRRERLTWTIRRAEWHLAELDALGSLKVARP